MVNGDDLPGNFKLGSNIYIRPRVEPIVSYTADYPTIAENVLAGKIPGSSAGGEQPNFTTYSGERGSHFIAKFSTMGDDAIAR